ncbi:MAG: hypothetical protein Q4A09_07210 [Capnocytophaga felis]|nr:hypothetical protein [Capnocytophaga felis]
MKKIIWLMSIAFCLIPIACKTKQVTTHQEEQRTELAQRLIQQEESTQKNSVSSEEIQTEIKELQELIANLNVSFEGKDLEDKLDILLKKTNEGTKLTFQGKGNVNYSESIKTEIERIEKELLKRQDSLFLRIETQQQQIRQKLDSYLKTKDKEVKVRGFTFGAWVYIVAGLVLLAVAGFLKFRPKLF